MQAVGVAASAVRCASRAAPLLLATLACCASAPAPVAWVASPPDDGATETAPYSASVAARFPPPAVRYLTPGLQPGRSSFTTNDELNAALASLAGSPRDGVVATLVELGASPQGVALRALHLKAARGGAGRRPTVLLIGQQHGDEPAPAEAMLVVASELARGSLAPLLEAIDVVVVPRANPDGAAAGRRVDADGIDVNRDHLLLRTPEARAIAALAKRYRPTLVIDAHEHTVVGRYLDKFHAVQRFDLLLQLATTPNLHPAIAQAGEQRFRRPLLEALAREGLAVEWYYTNSLAPNDLRLAMGGTRPDTGRNVYGLKNAVSVLLETRGVGIGRLHLSRRVHTHVVATSSLLRSAARDATPLLQLQQQADAAVAAQACDGVVDIEAEQTSTRRKLTMLDPDSGADREIDVAWETSLELKTTQRRARPCGYWLAPVAGDAVRRLRLLGVEVRQLDEPSELMAERWRETSRSEGQRADVRGSIADGASSALRVRVALEPERIAAPAGSYFVSLDQPFAHLAVAALEPDTQNSYFANRVLGALDDAARVVARPSTAMRPLP